MTATALSAPARLSCEAQREFASKNHAGDRPRDGRGRGGPGLRQRGLFRRRGLVVSPGGHRGRPSCWSAPSSRSTCSKGGCRFLKSPLSLLGLMALALGLLQLVPLPPALARQALAGRPRGLFTGDLAGPGPSRPAVGPARRAGRRFARRRRSTARRPCAGWWGRPRAWGSSGR